MSRIEATFAKAKSESRKVFVGYVMAYDPTPEISREIFHSMPEHGVDIIELGMPFSDPMADGVSIQLAAQRALKAGADIKKILNMVQDFRAKNTTTPIVLMGYYNPIYKYGVHSFVLDAVHAGVDGVIIVDLPPEEEIEFIEPAHKNGLHLIKLTAPTTNEARAKVITQHAGGFTYHIAVAGITGGKSADIAQLQQSVSVIRGATNLPLVVGFGIRTPEQAAEIAPLADGIVVGSALVEHCAKADVKGLQNLLQSIRKAI